MRPQDAVIYEFLHTLYGNVNSEGLVEISATNLKGSPVNSRLFGLNELEEATDFATQANTQEGVNVYFGVALRKPDTDRNKRSKDSDVLECHHLFLDLDDENALDNAKGVYTSIDLMPSLATITGTFPHPRGQCYWFSEEAITDRDIFKQCNLLLAHTLFGDTSITNISRLMRVAGSVAWAVKDGRIHEQTEMYHFPERLRYITPNEIINRLEQPHKSKPLKTGLNLLPERLNLDETLENVRNGAWHTNMRDAVASMVGRGFTDDKIQNMLAEKCENGANDPDLLKLIQSAREKFNVPNQPQNALQLLNDEKSYPIKASEFDLGTVPEREWLVKDWIPAKSVTALYGDGGVGKTLIAQQLANAIATGRNFAGLDVPQGKVLGVFCEDDTDELHLRQSRLEEYFGTLPLRRGMENFYLWARVGFDNLLVNFVMGEPQTTDFFDQLNEIVKDLQPSLLILDTASDLFGGNENDRANVNYFLKAVLGSFCVNHNLTVLLLAHPSQSGKNTGTGQSGSTAWNNAVRSRLYLQKVEGGEEFERVLTRKKANYATSSEDDKLELFFVDGALLTSIELPSHYADTLDNEKLADRIEEIVDEAEYSKHPLQYGHMGQALLNSIMQRLQVHYEKISRSRVEKVIAGLFEDGRIVRKNIKKRRFVGVNR